MANVVLFKLQDDDQVWMADLEAGTVERTDSDTAIDAGDEPFKGIDYAVAASARSESASHHMFPNRGIDFAVAAKVRPEAASHYFFPSR